ncbi:MAG: DUF4906 domain-containing protein [Bacteroidales bacterium]|nr:DUF4906 domain-containing protein [Bacteroidales bacterium]
MKHSGRFISLLLLAGFLSAGCAQLESPHSGIDPEFRDPVSVPIYLSVASEGCSTSATKVDYEPEDPAYNAADAIKTITILQFEKNAEGDGYTRVGNQVCYAWPLAAEENIALATSNRENIIFVIANATAPGEQTIPLSGSVSLDDFLKSENNSLLSTLDALDGTGIWYTPNGGTDKYLRMSASKVVDRVTLGTTLGTAGNPMELKRNCAKVVINVKNSSPAGDDKITINAVQLCSVNQKYYYVTDIPSSLSVLSFDAYSPANPCRFDCDEEAFPAAKNTDGTTQSYSWLVPVNMRGKNEYIVAQGNKNRYAPQGATYVSVHASYGSPAKHITYNYYLGENLTTDYNIAANKKYVFTIDIKDTGNPEGDSRIENRNEVVFSQDANSYMLTPPSRAGESTTYFIPVRRAAVFWNRPGINMGVYGAGTADAAVDDLTELTTWEARLVWNDVKDKAGNAVSNDDLLVSSNGKGFNPACSTSDPYIKINVMEGMKGNALVAIKKTGTSDDATLWSWHIWVTDYDPYVEMTPVADTYIYAVPNGEIHRYADKNGQTIWQNRYANGFIMDRNLGATAATVTNTADVNDTFGLYYQFGRKDPFRTDNDPVAVSCINTEQPGADGAVKQNIRYSVHQPGTFLTAGANWTAYETTGAILGGGVAMWHDPKFTVHGADNCEPLKSIYDPCPYGWQIPQNGVWYDFNATVTTIWQGGTLPHGRWYYPKGDPTNGRIWYPAAGGRTRGSGKIGGACGARGTWSHFWTISLYNETYPYRMMQDSGTVSGTSSNDWYAQNYIRRGDAYSLRCIRTSNILPY